MPSPEEQEAFVRAAVHGDMLGDWRESEAGRSDEASRFRLFEHEYGTPVDAGGQEDRGEHGHALAAQLLPERYPAARRWPWAASNWLTVEDLVSFDVGECHVFLRMDLAYRDARGPRGDRRLEDGPRRGPLQRGAARGLCPLRGAAGLGARAPRRSRPSSPTSPSRATCAAAWTRASSSTPAPSSRRAPRSMKALLIDPCGNLARLEDFPMIDRPQRLPPVQLPPALLPARPPRPPPQRRSASAALRLGSGSSGTSRGTRPCAPRRPWPRPRGSRPRGCWRSRRRGRRPS